MNIESIINNCLNKYNIPLDILDNYYESYRYYHNIEHIYSMVKDMLDNNWLSDKLLLAIIFHDIIYDPKRMDNEERSAELFSLYLNDIEIVDAILETKTHIFTSKLSEQLCILDLKNLNSDFKTFMEFENKIFKEYQFVDYSIYLERRIEILNTFNIPKDWIDYVKYRNPKIAIYPGSFNPFHKGHYNILQKAESIFDKVIIARGINVDKDNINLYDIPDCLNYHQVVNYDSLLTTYIDSLLYEVTVIRGLRNSEDFNYEKTQYRYLQDLDKDIKIVNIICDREFEHISSSGIRYLDKFNKGDNYLL